MTEQCADEIRELCRVHGNIAVAHGVMRDWLFRDRGGEICHRTLAAFGDDVEFDDAKLWPALPVAVDRKFFYFALIGRHLFSSWTSRAVPGALRDLLAGNTLGIVAPLPTRIKISPSLRRKIKFIRADQRENLQCR